MKVSFLSWGYCASEICNCRTKRVALIKSRLQINKAFLFKYGLLQLINRLLPGCYGLLWFITFVKRQIRWMAAVPYSLQTGLNAVSLFVFATCLTFYHCAGYVTVSKSFRGQDGLPLFKSSFKIIAALCLSSGCCG